jgi:hypothetical protein
MYGGAGKGATGEGWVGFSTPIDWNLMPPRAKRSPKSAGKAPAESDAASPFLRFHHSEELEARMLAVLTALEEAEDPEDHRAALADLVADLTESGMDYYFLRALRLADSGYMALQSARLGMSGAVKMISSVSRRFIMNMDRDQLLSVATHIRSLAR